MCLARLPSVVPATDVTILQGTGVCPAPNVDGTCIKVDVYRTAARGNALPMFFGGLVGLTQQDVRATATAQILAANATTCLKPWGVIDRWQENYPVAQPWTVNSTFNKYYTNGRERGDPEPGDQSCRQLRGAVLVELWHRVSSRST